ncbi:MAG: VWA domain-containing protein, partial [Nanoarchaeota archaeon]
MEISFTNPEYLWILLIVPIMIITHLLLLKKSRSVSLKFANFEAFERIKKGSFMADPYKGTSFNKIYLLLLVRIFTYVFLILSVTGLTLWYSAVSSDFDYVLAVDVSSSMLADDITPSRLIGAKDAGITFVRDIEKHANVGVLSFSGVSKVELQMTDDKDKIYEKINDLWLMNSAGTNLGEAIIQGSNMLIGSNSDKGKSVILLTDGQSNVGPSIIDATSYAKNNQVVVHTMGIGTKEGG